MHTPRNPRAQDVFSDSRKFFEKSRQLELYNIIHYAFECGTTTSEDILRLFREKEDEIVGEGGGGGAEGGTNLRKDSVVLRFEFESEKLDYPTQPVLHRMWDSANKRFFHYVGKTITLREIGGVIWIEPYGGTPQQHYVHLFPATGSNIILSESVIGYDIGFERFDADRRKFFIDIFEFPRESTSQMTQEIPTSTRKWRSDDYILTDAQLTNYTTDGLRFKCQIDLWCEI